MSAFAYKAAGVDELGRVFESNETIVSKLIETKKVDIDFEENAEVELVIHWYDKDEKFLSSSDAISADCKVEAPTGAEYARFQIAHESDKEIGFVDVFEYVSQVEIVYEKAD